MTEAGQTGLTEFGGDSEAADDRPEEEAVAVAGNGGSDAAEVIDVVEETLPESEGDLELAVMQVDYTIVGYGDEERPIMHVFGRTPDEELEHVQIVGFKPYFYAPTESLERPPAEEYDRLTGSREYDHDGDPYESIRGERLTKIFGQTPRDVGQVRDDFEHYEADILFPNRFLIDKDIRSGMRVPERRAEDDSLVVPHDEVEPVDVDADPRINTFDIEVDDRSGFPEDGEEPIVCLTSHDSYRDEYVMWLYEAPIGDGETPAEIDDYDPIEGEIDHEVRSFEEEEAMLEAFIEYVDETDPDVLTGWNFEDFDAPYFLDRLEELAGSHHEYDLSIDRLSRVDEVWRSNWGGPDIKGRVVFDLLYGYQRMVFSELDSYRLDAVGEAELGVGKERYAGDIGDLWEEDPTQLLAYNLRDVELCVELDRQQEIIPFWDEVRAFVGCKLEDAPTPGDAVDMYVLHEAHGRFALPSKGQQEAGEEYEGGAVFEPITGVKENVTVLDLKSLYPMCMTTINASPETKVDPDEYDGETYVAPTGTHFRKEPDGVNREMITELLAEREEKKELRDQHEPGSPEYEQYDRQQGAVKVIMNCFTPDTEVLTPNGVRDITDLEVGDEVYSLDPETEELEVKPVVETHDYPDYDGDLIDIETSKIDFRVTPNHRMLVRKNETNGITEDEYGFVEAGDLDRATNYELPHDWDGPGGEELAEVDLTELIDGEYEVWVRPSVHGRTFTAELGWTPRRVPKADIGKTGYVFTAEEFEEHREYIESVCETSFVHRESGRKWIPRTYDGDDFLDLLAWFVTEGNVYTSEDKQFGENFRGSATKIQLAQEKLPMTDGGGNHHATIGELLDDMGFDYYVDDRSYSVTSKLLGNLLRSLCGDGSFEKRIPEFVFDCSRRQKRRFLEGLIDGDGDRQVNSWRYSTSSDRLRDDVLRLCAHLGLTANYSRDSGTWRIYVTEESKNTLRMHRSSSRSTAENGVYCVTVEDNHTLLAGRNGKFQFVGQSLYGVSGWEQFRLYDKEAASAITATGREVIEFTDSAAQELDYQVTYGDTDSVMLELGPDVPKEEALEQSFEIEEYINGRYDDFAKDDLNAEFHRFQIEFEKLYRRFFQAGKKKRYAGHITWKEGKDVNDVDIVGFEYQRSDIAPITKEVQHRVIEMIVREGDIEGAKEYVNGVIEDVLAGEISLEEIAIPGGIGKRLDNYDTDTAQVRGAKYANLLLGTNFQRGSKPKRLYLERVDPSFFERLEAEEGFDARTDPLYGAFKRDPDVICFEYEDQIPEAFAVDYEKMLEKTLQGPIERILEALDISWDEVKNGQEQKGLDSFM
ncbi:DNA polymerase B elongation subunit [Natrinema pellirubrum DSM 15624]|uniref:DNA polymerase n=1 Tax=Natrinema pellirubrum (strain DSM 15624 / CIP 106293 / JCM 10476 / NCIMB 786 / 157) TaxID=797303 RepID=L0JP03_NATP1|nr:intein-containing DNA polymerase II [Natrinema pellirubrum]AGB32578.1 DNA polymerase elongation subunit (family B) [Natrinema pellirubrum DSM 15624]ELY73714.1 DNA polymerase B elongation subunit [Natrinema pellirubrum DSM 15624]